MSDPTDPLAGLAPPITPDPSALQWPWSNGAAVDPFAQGGAVAPAAPIAAATPDPTSPAGAQPGLGGVPAAALDAAVAPAPELGPPPGDVAPLAIPPEANPDVQPAPWGAAGLPPGSVGPGIAGPSTPGTLAEQPGLSITTEQPPNQAQQDAAAFTADPTNLDRDLLSRGRLSDEEAGQIVANLPPDQRAAVKAQLDQAKVNDYAAGVLKVSTENKIRAQHNADVYDKGMAAAQQAQTDLMADVKTLANQKIDPDRWWNGRSTLQKIAGYTAAIVGGLVQGRSGGPNIGLQGIQKAIDDDVEAQRGDLANQRASLSARQGVVGQMFAQTGDMYRSTETARAAMWESTVQQLQAEQQLYDPRGTTAMRIGDAIVGARAQQASIANALGQQKFKDHVETYKLGQEDAKQAEIDRHNRADEENSEFKIAAKYGGVGGGAGAGGAGAYAVPTGFYNPFDPSQPILGKRQIGGKGEDPKERNTVAAQISTYSHVQDGWAKLRAIGAKIDYHKSLGESAWSKFKSTDAAEYDAAREKLVVSLTKELGDKLTQGQLDLQAHRIPERTSVVESRDVGKMIDDAQSDADQDFSRDMELVGVDATPVIKSAQQRRAITQPSPEQDLDAAKAAAAASPADKNAKAAVDAAQQRVRDEVVTTRQRTADVAAAGKLAAPSTWFPENPTHLGLDPQQDVAVEEGKATREANRSAEQYKDLLEKFHAAQVNKEHLAGLTKPGDITAAKKANDRKLGDLAAEVLRRRTQYEHDVATAQKASEHANTFARAARAQAAIATGHGGEIEQRLEKHPDVDPTLPPPPPLPVEPDPADDWLGQQSRVVHKPAAVR